MDVTGLPETVTCSTESSCLTGLVMHTALETTGTVVFPDTKTALAGTLDAIHKAVVRSQLSNIYSVPTDCPTREKRGWMGDGQWTAEEAALNFDVHAVHVNWVTSMMDVQTRGCYPTDEQYALEPPYGTCCSKTLDPVHPTIFQCSPMSNSSDTEGSVPDVVPMLWGNGGGRGFPGAPVWGTAIVVIPDVIRSRFHDTAFLKASYGNFKSYMNFLKRQAKFAPGKVLPQFGLLGDWLSLDPFCPGGSDNCLKNPGWISGNPTTAFYYLVCVEAMSKIAAQIGNEADASAYAAEFAAGTASYHAVFYNKTAANYGHQQTANTMPLYLGAVPKELVATIGDTLANNIKSFPTASNGGHLSVGGVGSRWILQALTACNRTADALALATQTTQPSWGYFATNVPYTFWENWEQASGSFNHIMLGGGVDVWIYQHVAGIRLPSTRAARPFQQGVGEIPAHTVEFGVEAAVIEGVRACGAAVAVRGGQASSTWSWDDEGSTLRYNTTTPFAFTSTLSIPRRIGGRHLQMVVHGIGMGSDSTFVAWSKSSSSSSEGFGDSRKRRMSTTASAHHGIVISTALSSAETLAIEMQTSGDNMFVAHYSN